MEFQILADFEIIFRQGATPPGVGVGPKKFS